MISKTTPLNIYPTPYIIRHKSNENNKKNIPFGINPLNTVKQNANLTLYRNNMTFALEKMTKLAENFIPKSTAKQINILDIGSCDGELLRSLRKKFPYIHTTGLEINPEMIQNAIKIDQSTNLNQNINYIAGNAHNIANFDVKPDIVLMSKILHEIYSYDNPILNNIRFSLKSIKIFLKNLYSKLNDGAKVIIRDPAKPKQPDDLYKLTDINPSAQTTLIQFLTNFKPAANKFTFENNDCIAPK